MLDPSFQKKRKAKWRYPIGAVLFHIVVLGGLVLLEIHLRREMIKDEVKKMLEVRPISSADLKKIMSRSRVVDTQWLEEKDLEAIKDQKAYAGEKTQRVKEETRDKEEGSVRGKDKGSSIANLKRLQLKENPFGRKLKKSEKTTFKKGTYDVLDPSIKVADKTLLNTDAYIHATFINRMKESITAAWGPRWRKVADKRKKELTAGVYVTVTRIYIKPDGTITDVGIARSSGFPDLDKAASDSILEVRSFPNPPPDMFGPKFDGSFDFTFLITLTPAKIFRFNFVPDEKLDRPW